MADISLNAIARESGLAKSNIYRYFSSREEIFLALLLQDIEGWATRADALIDALPQHPHPEDIAHAMTTGMIDDPRMVRLLGQLVSVLEQNASVDAIVDFKLRVRDLVAVQAATLTRKLPWLSLNDAIQLTYLQVALLQGMWPNHQLTPKMKQALQHPDLHQMNMSLEDALKRSITVMIRGLRAEALGTG